MIPLYYKAEFERVRNNSKNNKATQIVIITIIQYIIISSRTISSWYHAFTFSRIRCSFFSLILGGIMVALRLRTNEVLYFTAAKSITPNTNAVVMNIQKVINVFRVRLPSSSSSTNCQAAAVPYSRSRRTADVLVTTS